MGIPELIIEFRKKALDFRFRSEKGVMALILKETTPASKAKTLTFTDFKEVKEDDFTADNYNFIKLAFMGNPTKVIVETVDDFNQAEMTKDLTQALKNLELKIFSYLAIPELPEEKGTDIETWITTQRKAGKAFKAVLNGVTANNEKGLINFASEGIQVGEKTYTGLQYTPRIAGILAGLPSTQSCTYYVLEEVDAVTAIEDETAAVDAGKLILTNDGEKIKIVRGVTALTQVDDGELEDFKKIKILDTADMIRNDIVKTWNDYYVGKVMNTYPNKCLFFAAVKGYLDELQKQDILDPSKENIIDIDMEEQKKYISKKGIDISKLLEQEIKEYNTDSYVFAEAEIKIADAMEDLKLKFYM